MSSTPRFWSDFDLLEFLDGQGWRQVQVTSRRRGTWHVRALWRCELEGDNRPWLIKVQTAVQTSRKVPVLQNVRGFFRRLSSQTDEPMTEAITAPTVVEAEDRRDGPTAISIGAAVAPDHESG